MDVIEYLFLEINNFSYSTTKKPLTFRYKNFVEGKKFDLILLEVLKPKYYKGDYNKYSLRAVKIC